MNTARVLLIVIVMASVFAVSCASKKDRVFYAFTDSFMDWYKLEMYSDNNFSLHVPVIDYSGTYKVIGDTIFLSYNNDTAGLSTAPIAYLIHADKKKIDELYFDEDLYQIRTQNNRWIGIVENKLSK